MHLNWTPINDLHGLWLPAIYAIRHRRSGRVLICASSRAYPQAWSQIEQMRAGTHFNRDLQRDADADGLEGFDVFLIQRVPHALGLRSLKQYWLDKAASNDVPLYNRLRALPRSPHGAASRCA